ncbi:inhibin beta C chain-like [Lissotriton helveticus]
MAPWSFRSFIHLLAFSLVATSGEEACPDCNRRPAAEPERKMLVELAKRTILSKLDLKEQPNFQPAVSRAMLAAALSLHDRQEAAADQTLDEEEHLKHDGLGQTYEIMIFPEADCSNNSGLCLQFQFNLDEESRAEIFQATVWIFLVNSYNRRSQVTVTSYLCQSDCVDHSVAQRMPLRVWRSGWYKIPFAPSKYQALTSGEKKLRIHLGCKGCIGGLRLANISGANRPFIVAEARRLVVHPLSQRSLTCNSNSDTCCRRSFYVNFKEIGWNNWIIKPEGYYMNYCKGQCPISLAGNPGTAASFHTAVYNLIKANNVLASMGSCCVATHLQPLSLLYFDNSTNVIKKDIANMIVERCGCT